MCDTCGCNITHGNEHLIQAGGKHSHTLSGRESVEVLQNLLSENDHQAAHNRNHFDAHQVLAVNLMSSPGAGKTTLLESTIDLIGDGFNIAVIEGDLETENDAQRIRAKNIPAVQITTGTACHLDAHMVHSALHQIELESVDIVFIENVGNLVCPASFDLGQHQNVILLSVPEGDDKPAKYPVMFRAADLVLITKNELLPYFDDFDPQRAERYVRELANPAPVLSLSAKQNIGMDRWIEWLKQQVSEQKNRVRQGMSSHPKIQPDGVQLHSHPHHQDHELL